MDLHTRVAVMVPHIYPASWTFVRSLWGTPRPRGWYIGLIDVGGLPVDEARNELVRTALQSEMQFQYFLMCDQDMEWHPQSLQRLISRLALGVDMVGALTFTRYFPVVPVIFREKVRATVKAQEHWPYVCKREWLYIQVRETMAWLEKHPEAVVRRPVVLDPPPDDAMVRADATGGAFVLFKRDVLAALEPPWFVRDALKKGEDFHFFQNARKAGFRLWIDRSVIVNHEWGGATIGVQDFLASMTQVKLEADPCT